MEHNAEHDSQHGNQKQGVAVRAWEDVVVAIQPIEGAKAVDVAKAFSLALNELADRIAASVHEKLEGKHR